MIFVSHQWLTTELPDPTGFQMQALRRVLKGVIEGSMTVETDIISQTYASQQTFSADRLVDGYLWMDWFSIPQVRARAKGVDEEETKSDAAKAIQSIPAYVEVSTAFLALVPAVRDSDKINVRNYTSWLA